MTFICLVRHGETDWNAAGRRQGTTDIPLNDRGIRQAKECGQYLRQFDWDVLISSPLKRAKETAEIINQHLHLPLVEMDSFVERHFGEAEGKTREEVYRLYPDKNYPGQELTEVFQQRIMDGIKSIHDHYPNKRVLLVAHGAVIASIISLISDAELRTSRDRLLNACINTIQFEKTKWNVKSYNETGHLSERP